MIKEFRQFILRGNVLDLAVGVIIGAAFGAIVNSLVNDIIMPPIGLVLGGVNFTDLFIALDGQSYTSLKAAQDAGAPIIAYGNFIQTVVNFLIIAFVIFMIIRAVNRVMPKKPEEVVVVGPDPSVVAQQDLTAAIKQLNETMSRR